MGASGEGEGVVVGLRGGVLFIWSVGNRRGRGYASTGGHVNKDKCLAVPANYLPAICRSWRRQAGWGWSCVCVCVGGEGVGGATARDRMLKVK